MTRVFVTGANGFMGSRSVRERLARGYGAPVAPGSIAASIRCAT